MREKASSMAPRKLDNVQCGREPARRGSSPPRKWDPDKLARDRPSRDEGPHGGDMTACMQVEPFCIVGSIWQQCLAGLAFTSDLDETLWLAGSYW